MSTATTRVNERLAKLSSAGVSVWLDQIRRTLITGGELHRLAEEESLRGVTANPSIFEKAILGSDDYDEELQELSRQELSAQEIYDRIAQRDVQMACDVLADFYREANGNDGFVSLEVAPEIAYDTERTLDMARVYWKAVNRPNLMIKIPGTPAGVPAIEQAIYEGINVNVTLLFAVEAYERVAEAYLRGLERRQAEGLTLDVKSVASFFVSRVDTNVDKKLEALGRTDLAGRAAVANARAAYRRFKEIFNGPRWEALHHAGAHVQRPCGHPRGPRTRSTRT
jgi:transaldolase